MSVCFFHQPHTDILKGYFTKKWKFTHYLLTTLPMGGWVKCLSPQNTSWVSGVNSVAAESSTIEVNSDLFFRHYKTTEKNITCLHTAPVVSSKCPQAPTFIFDSRRCHYTMFLVKCPLIAYSEPRLRTLGHTIVWLHPLASLLPVVAIRLKTWCKLPRFKSNMNVGACGHLDDTTRAVWRHVVFFLFYYVWSSGHLGWNTVYPRNSSSVLWTGTCHGNFCNGKHKSNSCLSGKFILTSADGLSATTSYDVITQSNEHTENSDIYNTSPSLRGEREKISPNIYRSSQTLWCLGPRPLVCPMSRSSPVSPLSSCLQHKDSCTHLPITNGWPLIRPFDTQPEGSHITLWSPDQQSQVTHS